MSMGTTTQLGLQILEVYIQAMMATVWKMR